MAALELHIGDITRLAVDAIVNAANETLRADFDEIRSYAS